MQPDPSTIIDAIGGTRVVAELCRVNDSAVSQWRRDGIPEARMMFLRIARPKIFKRLAAEASAEKSS